MRLCGCDFFCGFLLCDKAIGTADRDGLGCRGGGFGFWIAEIHLQIVLERARPGVGLRCHVSTAKVFYNII